MQTLVWSLVPAEQVEYMKLHCDGSRVGVRLIRARAVTCEGEQLRCIVSWYEYVWTGPLKLPNMSIRPKRHLRSEISTGCLDVSAFGDGRPRKPFLHCLVAAWLQIVML